MFNASIARPVAAAMVLLAPVVAMNCAATDAPLRFNRDIRPILSDNCFRCHGPELKSRKAGLRLDVREVAVAKEAIVPGKPDDSELIYRLTTSNPDDQMPPEETHKVVTPEQIETLRKWIAAGAAYEPHWSYAPIQRPALPDTQHPSTTPSTVDRFILARLEEQRIAPSPVADRRTLLRRLSLDLTGLPPAPAAVEAFVKDRSPRAYEKQVERLLASPHYGERMAVPWLDAVRFADTVGYHGDQNQNIFPYRDYVIAAFNANKPFDQFTVEQIAGDLLPNPTVEQQVATGFNRLNMMTREGGAQPKEYLAKYAADRVRTISTAWLGSTMACCECHDHKYDPFTAKDFYSLAAFFDDVKQWGVYQDYDYTPNPELEGWSNDHPFPPELRVTNQFLVQLEKKRLQEKLDFVRAESRLTSAAAKKEFLAWQESLQAILKAVPDGWQPVLTPMVKVVNTNSDVSVTLRADGTVLCLGKRVRSENYEVEFAPPTGWVSAIRLELLPAAEFTNSSLRATHGSAMIKFEVAVRRAGQPKQKWELLHSEATARESNYANGHETLGVHPEWRLKAAAGKERQHAVYVLNPPVLIAEGDVLTLNLKSEQLGCFRLATSPVGCLDPLYSGATPALRAALKKTGWRRSPAQQELLATTWWCSTTNQPGRYAGLTRRHFAVLNCRHGVTPTLVTVATTNRLITRVLPRGNWQDESGEIVAPAVPHFLPQPKTAGTNHLTRLDLARWLASRDNPLTARAFVNRLWKQFFGNGLSNVPEDLGAQGEWPSHPELLDWLSAEFIESGWDVKHIVRLMVLSATYQQDAKLRPELIERDPHNRLLARQNPRRLEAEFVRDNALAISGLLDGGIGGPSVFPYQPDGYYANLQFPDREYVASLDEQQHRRGIYTHWQRTFLHPMLANFDAPSREECTVDRPTSSTPQQALTLLNDPTFVEAARALAEKILRAPKLQTDADRVNFALETALLRPATPAERKSLVEFLQSQRGAYSANEADARKLAGVGGGVPGNDLPVTELAAWTSLGRVLLNLHETITRY